MTEGLLAKNTAGFASRRSISTYFTRLLAQQSRPQPRRQSRHSRYRLFSTTAIGNFTSQTIVPGRFTSYGPHSSYRTESKPTSSALGTEATCPKSTYLNALGIAECTGQGEPSKRRPLP
ncbi:hypothetical protein PILCRDRAFT_266638 [Piloderma croceum F 1598]|uniref:Uncharacterized protein n=1 Tax=Piloderma croceum (strain F 1598) TaxID=765440 RepID=A0A0C3BN77_PILCF|nr:hypothetical protein PILCRDRAFT_266638 [Piloderma croceum F 1598]